MSVFLYTDTETSCLNHKRIVQLACVLATTTEEIASLNVLIRPDGWVIDPGAEAVHGISMEKSMKYGIAIETALWLFDSLAENADFMVCHNIGFDDPVIQAEYRRLGREFKKPGICTMNETTPILKIPSKRGYGFKWPSLMEAHVWATGETFEGAHDGMADCRACMAVHREILRLP